MIFDWAILLGIRLIGLQVDVVRLHNIEKVYYRRLFEDC